MTKASRNQIAGAFVAAKALMLANEEEAKPRASQGICFHLMLANIECIIPKYVWIAAKRIISKRLGGPNVLVSKWLKNVVGVDPKLLIAENLYAYRLRWLDALIEEFDHEPRPE